MEQYRPPTPPERNTARYAKYIRMAIMCFISLGVAHFLKTGQSPYVLLLILPVSWMINYCYTEIVYDSKFEKYVDELKRWQYSPEKLLCRRIYHCEMLVNNHLKNLHGEFLQDIQQASEKNIYYVLSKWDARIQLSKNPYLALI